MNRESAGFLVHGRVQGVGFRWWTTRQARELGLAGTVRNRPDGAVEVFVSGPAAAVQRFRERLEEGPRTAVVRSVEPLDPPPDLPSEFTIVR
ncbi:MAG: acylphosphatase [Gemmatimonadota bacterium]